MNQAKFDNVLQTLRHELDAQDPLPILRAIERAFVMGHKAYLEGTRVRVRDGTGEKDLGEGVIVDHVTVYVRIISENHIESLRFAEEPFEGAKAVEDNVKIQMDDGSTRYGCQVWWEPVERNDA